MSITVLLAAVMAVAPAPVAAPASETPVAPVAAIEAAPAAPAAEGFLSEATVACPAGATRTTFPLVPNTLVELETVDPVGSKTSHPGDPFTLRVREPLRYGAVELIPAGTLVHGDVVHAGKSKLGGQAGELNLSARYIQLPQGRVRLHGSFGASGKNRAGATAATVILFGIAGMAVHGSNTTLVPGTPLSVRLADPITFRCDGASASAPPTSPVSTPVPAAAPTTVPEPAN